MNTGGILSVCVVRQSLAAAARWQMLFFIIFLKHWLVFLFLHSLKKSTELYSAQIQWFYIDVNDEGINCRGHCAPLQLLIIQSYSIATLNQLESHYNDMTKGFQNRNWAAHCCHSGQSKISEWGEQQATRCGQRWEKQLGVERLAHPSPKALTAFPLLSHTYHRTLHRV